MNSTIQINYSTHPGIKLKERLVELCMSQAECAKRMGRPEKTVSEIVNGKTSITPKTAQDFVYVLGLPAHYWNQLQADYDLAKARRSEKEKLFQSEQVK